MRPTILILFLLVQFTFAADPEIKGTSGELTAYLSGIPKLVSISGEREVKAVADRAKVTLKVSTESKSLVESLRLNQEARGRVVSFLKENGIGPDQVQAARFSSTQKHGIFSEKAKSHRIENFLKITVRDEKEFQAVASTVDRLAEVHFLGIDFEHSNKEKLKT